MKTIKCFRHGVKQPEVIQDSSYVMFQKRKLSHRDYSEFILIGADSDNIYYNGHTVPIYPGVLSFKQSDRVLVLTCKEVELIYSSGLINQFDLLCLEQLFPFLHGIFYKSDAKSNYRTLVDKISKLRRYKIDFDYIHRFYSTCYNTILRSISRKRLYDRNFFYVPAYTYQEVFKFKEEREDRVVVALDFNSMFATAMTDTMYPNPETLEYKKLNCFYDPNFNLEHGMYFVKLSEPDEFIKKYHALRYNYLAESSPFFISDDLEIETYLTNLEIDYYRKHFNKILLIDSFSSPDSIQHPLKNKCLKLYKERLHYKNHGNSDLAGLNKLYLALMHSFTNGRTLRKKEFPKIDDAIFFLDSTLGISKPENISKADFLLKINRNHLRIINSIDKIEIYYPSPVNDTNIYSLYSLVIANSRVKMMKTIELFQKFSELEVCYTNVDSIHVSIPKDKFKQFKQYLEDNKLIGEELGRLKIENISQHGVWFFPGRYWLYDNDHIVQFKNVNLNSKDKNNLLSSQKRITFGVNAGEFVIPQFYKQSINDTCYLRKVLEENNFRRKQISEIVNFEFDKNNKSLLKKRFREEFSRLELLFK